MRELYKKLSYLLTPREKRNGLILFGLTAFGAAFEVVGVGAIPAFVGVIAMPERLLEIGFVQAAYDFLGLESPEEMVIWAALGLIAIFLFKNAYLGFMTWLRARYTYGRQVNMSNRLFQAYLFSPYSFHLQRNTAELLRNTNSEAVAITSGVLMPILSIAMEVMVLVFIFVLLFALEPLITVITFAVFGTLTFAFLLATRKKVRYYRKEEQRQRRLSVQAVNQGLGGFKDARILGRENFFLDTYRNSQWVKARAGKYKQVISALPRLFLETVAVIGMLGISVMLVAQGREMETIIPTLTLLGVAIIRMMPLFTKMAGDITNLKWGQQALSVVYDDLMQLEEEEKRLRKRLKSAEPISFEREIRIENLTFQYAGQAGYALRDVSLVIPKYTSAGFVGPSGAGKTTIVDVILGLLTPTEGQVLVDDTDIQERLPSWQRKIGYIPQHIYLTDDTIRNNVAFGMPEDEISDERVWEAVEAAQLRELIETLPDGLDTIVGERGIRLSGGQRQRIGIARALYHRPQLLVMDEATSALDNQTERQFVEALKQLQGEHTLIVIAHRLSTVRHCDTLFMLDEGHLVAQGSYDELMITSEVFRGMAGGNYQTTGQATSVDV